jgi:Integrase core domain
MYICSALFLFFRSLFVSRISLATETMVLRQQLLVLNRTVKRPKLRRRDRLFLVCLSKLWGGWREALIIVKPDTVIKWHREGFRLYWRWKSKAPNSPFQNPYAERVIDSIRRECLDHLIVLNEDHLRRILRQYFDYYHNSRPHRSLERNSPAPREIEPPSKGKVIAFPQVGGLHHRYRRAA